MENNNYSYTVNEETFAVGIFKNESEVASLYQPGYPNGEPWEDANAAEAWALAWIAEHTDPEAPEAPEGPGIEGRAKPIEETEEPTE